MRKLSEARRNPEVNSDLRSKNVLDQIEPFFFRDDAFISMVDLSKVGINPKTGHYTTPNGIYTYPLDSHEIVSNVLNSRLPYKNDAPNIALIFAKPSERWYTSSASVDEVKNLVERVDAMMGQKVDPEFWETCKSFAFKTKENIKEYSAIYGYNVVWMAASVMSSGVTDENTVRNKAPRGFVNLMMKDDTRRPSVWNALWRKLGYDVLADYGTSMIFSLEPTQVCFLTTAAIKDYKLFRNGRSLSHKPEKMIVSLRQLRKLYVSGKITTRVLFFHLNELRMEHSDYAYDPRIKLTPELLAANFIELASKIDWEATMTLKAIYAELIHWAKIN